MADASSGDEDARARYSGPVSDVTAIIVCQMRRFPKPMFIKYAETGHTDAKLLLELAPLLGQLLCLQKNLSFKQSTMQEAVLEASKQVGKGDVWFHSRVEEVEWAEVMSKRLRHACRHTAQALLKAGRRPYWAQQVTKEAGIVEIDSSPEAKSARVEEPGSSSAAVDQPGSSSAAVDQHSPSSAAALDQPPSSSAAALDEPPSSSATVDQPPSSSAAADQPHSSPLDQPGSSSVSNPVSLYGAYQPGSSSQPGSSQSAWFFTSAWFVTSA